MSDKEKPNKFCTSSKHLMSQITIIYTYYCYYDINIHSIREYNNRNDLEPIVCHASVRAVRKWIRPQLHIYSPFLIEIKFNIYSILYNDDYYYI